MNNLNGKWLCARSMDEEWWKASNYHDTKEAAIKAGIKAANEYNNDPENSNVEDELGFYEDDDYAPLVRIAVGQCFIPAITIDPDHILENVYEQVEDDIGEIAEGYLADVKQEHKDELQDLIHEWFIKHNYIPSCFVVQNVEEVNVKGADE